MKLLDFFTRKPPEPEPAPPPPTEPPKADLKRKQSPRQLMGSKTWSVQSSEDGTWPHDQVQVAFQVDVAQSLRSIADDLAAIRKHVTRLQLVRERYVYVDPHVEPGVAKADDGESNGGQHDD